MRDALDATFKAARTLGLAALAATLLSVWLLQPEKAAGPDGFYGMVVDPEVDAEKAIPRLGELGVHTVRLRMDVKDWARPEANTGSAAYDGALTQAPKLESQGFRVVLLVASEGGGMPSYERAKGLFEWLLDRPGAKSVDVFEVLGPVTVNASNADAFSLTLSLDEQANRYVDGPLRAADEVFHKARRKVLGGSFTPWQQRANLDVRGAFTSVVTDAYLRAGYLDRVDYAGLRPTLATPAAQVDWVRQTKPKFDETPVWVSEWALDSNSFPDPADYAAGMNQAASGLHGQVAVACYLAFTPGEDSYGVAKAGLGGYQPIQPAFGTYQRWPKT